MGIKALLVEAFWAPPLVLLPMFIASIFQYYLPSDEAHRVWALGISLAVFAVLSGSATVLLFCCRANRRTKVSTQAIEAVWLPTFILFSFFISALFQYGLASETEYSRMKSIGFALLVLVILALALTAALAKCVSDWKRLPRRLDRTTLARLSQSEQRQRLSAYFDILRSADFDADVEWSNALNIEGPCERV
jgi:hypothetical protein